MSTRSKIEWTDKTWNPVTGCSKVSPGCAHCYAERLTNRFFGPGAFDRVLLHPERLEQPLRWRRPSHVFVNSMSDLFHEEVPFQFIGQVWTIMSSVPEHTFQILTKRPARMLTFTRWMAGADDISIAEWPRNVWLGVSVENQHWADQRIPLLLQTPAAVRFISAEPLLGPIDLKPRPRRDMCLLEHPHPGSCKTHGLDWVIVGGESGPKARPMHPDWARSLRDQCQAAGVPFFFKQWGGPRSKRGGDQALLDGRLWHQFPQLQGVASATEGTCPERPQGVEG